MFKELNEIANYLEKYNLHKEASAITKVMKRLSDSAQKEQIYNHLEEELKHGNIHCPNCKKNTSEEVCPKCKNKIDLNKMTQDLFNKNDLSLSDYIKIHTSSTRKADKQLQNEIIDSLENKLFSGLMDCPKCKYTMKPKDDYEITFDVFCPKCNHKINLFDKADQEMNNMYKEFDHE